MKTRIINIITLAFIGVISIKGQDIRTSQNFYANPLNVNPAVMGMNTDLKAVLNYRSQWKSAGGGYSSYSFTGMYPLYMKGGAQKLDFGLNVLNDKQGAFNNLKAGLAVGYNLKLNETGFLSFALQGSFNQRNLTANGLTFDDQYVLGQYSASNATNQTISNQSVSFANMSAGLMWYFNPSRENSKLNAYFGMSGYNLVEPNLTYNTASSPLYKRISFQGGVKLLGENKIDVMPNFYANIQNGSEEFAGGLILDYNMNETSKIVFGAWYRKKDSYPLMLGVDVSGFSFKYSYDLTNSYMSGQISGLTTHSITLAYKLNMAEKKGGRNQPSLY